LWHDDWVIVYDVESAAGRATSWRFSTGKKRTIQADFVCSLKWALIANPSQKRGRKRDSNNWKSAKSSSRRWTKRSREKLRDPEFRKIEGFPIGDDQAILALSGPPYYTACPNPFLPEIIARWQEERRQLRAELGLPDDSPPLRGEGPGEGSNGYAREPFAADISEGKNTPHLQRPLLSHQGAAQGDHAPAWASV